MIHRLVMMSGVVEDDEENEKMPAASIRELPSAELEGLWDKYEGIARLVEIEC